MIFDRIDNLSKYNLDTMFVFNDLAEAQFDKGKCVIDGEHKFRIDLTYSTQAADKALWEAHRKYLDIHVIIEGQEYIDISDINLMKSAKDYEDDYELFSGIAEHRILLKEGFFLVLFPHEVHKTGIAVNEVNMVRKKVFKLLTNE